MSETLKNIYNLYYSKDNGVSKKLAEEILNGFGIKDLPDSSWLYPFDEFCNPEFFDFIIKEGGELSNYLTLRGSITHIPQNITRKDFRDLKLYGSFNDLSSLKHINSIKNLFLHECVRVDNLEPIGDVNIGSLDLFRIPIKSLKGLERLDSLTTLIINDLMELEDTSFLSGVKNLKKLIINNCQKITDLSCLSELHNLESIEIINCKGITNIPIVSEDIKFIQLSDLNVDDLDFITNSKNLLSCYLHHVHSKKPYTVSYTVKPEMVMNTTTCLLEIDTYDFLKKTESYY